MSENIEVSAPGRICLFGEHQDYLGLPVIAAAISKRIYIKGNKRNDSVVNIAMPDLGTSDSFELNGVLEYKYARDYFRSAYNILVKNGFRITSGFDCTIHSDIPINAGTSSSSALVVAFIKFLLLLSGDNISTSPEEIASIAYKSEVLEFAEPGGMMDQYSTSVGGIIWLGSVPNIELRKISARPGNFILGNSGEPKDTISILSRVKLGVLNIAAKLKKENPEFSLQSILEKELSLYSPMLTPGEYSLLCGTIRNRDITFQAERLFYSETPDKREIGELLNEHQRILKDTLRISTPKIDRMIEAALYAGAYGAKINGSGGGGCMFAFVPENTAAVLENVKIIADDSFIVQVDEGVRQE